MTGQQVPGLSGISKGVAGFAQAAANGQVSIDPDAVRGVLNKIRGAKDEVAALLRSAAGGVVRADGSFLGANQVGTAMSTKFARRGEGGEHSLHAVLQGYLDELAAAERAIETCTRNYQSRDTGSARRLGAVDTSVDL
ncbi:hypothetical protein EV193_103543 [Herbihabitans rhizosphaerae]|uniref:Uncharacterized protein n=1 Tax=Herbihabitans rhizosphaerae TaxID=1872711 RepID=A0A4V2ETI8_9PSEU|nr:hypothetical protein [Herbihabitans rhizosphaerae]RZS41223.1 hypothetical protein EV193_103543 [Herbihabitans rhizosphaerae]